MGESDMSKEINILSADKTNKLEGYNRFSHTKDYLKQKTDLPIDHYYKNQTDEINLLAEKCGYSKFNRFLEYRKDWHQLERKIPLTYLNEIEVELKTLEFTAELDLAEYKKVLEIKRIPKYYTIRMHPAFYKTEVFKDLFTEEEAIEYVKEYAIKEERICFIQYPSIKTITIHPDGKVDEIYHEPGIHITDKYLIPTVAGKDIGKVRLL